MPFDSPMTAVRQLGRKSRWTLVETASVDNPGGTQALGQFNFLPTFLGITANYRLQATFSTSKGSITGSVQLYNVTDGEAVTGGLLQTSSTSPTTEVGVVLTVGSAAGNLKDTSKLYEIRASVTGSDATDILSIGSVALSIA